MFSKNGSVTFETPSAPNQHPVTISGSKRFGKKPYAIAGIIAITVIAVALLIPQGAATIPLNVEYTVGEKMIYETVENVTNQWFDNVTTESRILLPLNTVTFNFLVTEEVVAFDGEFYTLNHTVSTPEGHGPRRSISYLEIVNKTGYSSYLLPEGTQGIVSNASSNPIVTALLEKAEVTVGESWQIPLNVGNSNGSMTGTLTLTFGGIQEITVPSGTYAVSKIDASGTDIVMTINISGVNMNVSRTLNMNQQIYIEYGTCKQIQSNIQSVNTIVYLDTGRKLVSNISTQTTLIQDIKP